MYLMTFRLVYFLTFFCCSRSRESSTSSADGEGQEESETALQPHCHITIKCTKEVSRLSYLL